MNTLQNASGLLNLITAELKPLLMNTGITFPDPEHLVQPAPNSPRLLHLTENHSLLRWLFTASLMSDMPVYR